MYITDAIGNISERFIAEKINIIYKPNNNLFDFIISLLPYNIYCVNETSIPAYNNITHILPSQFADRQYNIEINNSLLGFANQKRTNTMIGLNNISCCHHEKIPMIKKEDLFILRNNLNTSTKIFFSKFAMNSWQFNEKTYLLEYGVPKKIINKNIDTKNDEVLLFNLDNKNIKVIESVLSSNNISYYTATKIDEILFNKMNTCKLCLEMSDANIVNALCGIACGAMALVPMTNMIRYDFADTLNLHTFTDIQTMVMNIKKCLISETIPDNIEEKFPISNFIDSMKTIVENVNREVVSL